MARFLLDTARFPWYCIPTNQETILKHPSICKFCKQQFVSFRELKFHCEEEHPRQFNEVAGWIGKTVTPRLETFEKLAAEGMIGVKEGSE